MMKHKTRRISENKQPKKSVSKARFIFYLFIKIRIDIYQIIQSNLCMFKGFRVLIFIMMLQFALGQQLQIIPNDICNITGCVECPDQEVCLHCNQSANFNPQPNAKNTCDCSKGNYLLKDRCLNCNIAHPYCLQCTPTGTLCTKCLDRYYIVGGNCASCGNNCFQCIGPTKCDKCANGSHWNGSICQSCGVTNCQTCSKANECDKCQEGYELKTTTTLGRKRYICEKCSENCKQCKDATNCNVCQPGFYVNGGKCLSCSVIKNCTQCQNNVTCGKCQYSYYLNGGKCSTCQTPENHCISCIDTSNCLSCISQEYYLNGICAKCLDSFDGCLTCKIVGSEGICLSCIQSYYLSNNKECLLCSSFDIHCIECKGEQQCTKCLGENNFYIENGKCRTCSIISGCWQCLSSTECTSCVQRFYVKVKDQCIRCENVLTNCKECISQTQCSKCQTNYYPIDVSCVACSVILYKCQTCEDANNCKTCVKGFYSNASKVCVSCSQLANDCVECSNDAVCTKCTQGKYVAEDKQCSDCMMNCVECREKDVCDGCKEGFALNEKNTCQVCSSRLVHCLKCDDLKTCSQCQQNSFLVGSKCITCGQLVTSCEECTVEGCSKCQDGYELKDKVCNQVSSSTTAKIIVGVISGIAVIALGGYLIYRKMNRKKLLKESQNKTKIKDTILTESQEDQKENLID